MNLEEYKGVFVFAQQVDNKLNGIALELVGKGKDLAKDLGTEVTAVLIGSDVMDLTKELAEYGADRIIVVDDPELKEYRTEPYAHALAEVIKKYKPEIMLVGATAIGRDLGPRVSARIHTGLTADCTQLEIGDFPINPIPGREQLHNQLLMTRPAFGGNTIATIACPNFRPQMATVRPGVMQKAERVEGAQAVIEEFNPGFVLFFMPARLLFHIAPAPAVHSITFDKRCLLQAGSHVSRTGRSDPARAHKSALPS